MFRWIDADIVVMNPNIPLEIFIPPSPEFSYVNMLATNDRHGLNNGCFLIRISSWAVKLLSGVIAFHNFKPDVELKYSEQSALEEMIEDVSIIQSSCHFGLINTVILAQSCRSCAATLVQRLPCIEHGDNITSSSRIPAWRSPDTLCRQ